MPGVHGDTKSRSICWKTNKKNILKLHSWCDTKDWWWFERALSIFNRFGKCYMKLEPHTYGWFQTCKLKSRKLGEVSWKLTNTIIVEKLKITVLIFRHRSETKARIKFWFNSQMVKRDVLSLLLLEFVKEIINLLRVILIS